MVAIMAIPPAWVPLTRPSLVGGSHAGQSSSLPVYPMGARHDYESVVEEFGKFTFLQAYGGLGAGVWIKAGCPGWLLSFA
jgi:hypothetical protein